ncbi:Mitochodrial transcription termination factor [Parasponia andersonii]|uniref:Mitochodrial transcription termination factor n=1 Tax=Parasponia andersonii TaxID=3476 RepID=A0A2P5DM87_PARAD|nr:Mitochodrial transcription termination factor [Parasponia andersonii]
MKSRFGAFMMLRRVLLPDSLNLFSLPRRVVFETRMFCSITTCSTNCQAEVAIAKEEGEAHSKGSREILRSWGCSEGDISKMFVRRPSLRNADLAQLQSKLNLLSGLGISASELVKIINCRPRFLSCRINRCFDERLQFLMTLFESNEVLVKAIVRNPSLLTYDFQNRIKPTIALYEEMGLSKKDLTAMLLLRPTLIPRTSFDDEKLEYIRKTGLSHNSKMYKYIVTLIGVSRLETIRRKIANLEKFGFTEGEVFGLLGRSPLVLTLSVDKVQRNMTFILGTMKLQAEVILEHPNLLYSNLEAVLKPRFLLMEKMKEMGLELQIEGPDILRALRMQEKRFLKAFVDCHPKDVAVELVEFYVSAKGIKRLAVTSKKNFHQGFPF